MIVCVDKGFDLWRARNEILVWSFQGPVKLFAIARRASVLEIKDQPTCSRKSIDFAHSLRCFILVWCETLVR